MIQVVNLHIDEQPFQHNGYMVTARLVEKMPVPGHRYVQLTYDKYIGTFEQSLDDALDKLGSKITEVLTS